MVDLIHKLAYQLGMRVYHDQCTKPILRKLVCEYNGQAMTVIELIDSNGLPEPDTDNHYNRSTYPGVSADVDNVQLAYSEEHEGVMPKLKVPRRKDPSRILDLGTSISNIQEGVFHMYYDQPLPDQPETQRQRVTRQIYRRFGKLFRHGFVCVNSSKFSRDFLDGFMGSEFAPQGKAFDQLFKWC